MHTNHARFTSTGTTIAGIALSAALATAGLGLTAGSMTARAQEQTAEATTSEATQATTTEGVEEGAQTAEQETQGASSASAQAETTTTTTATTETTSEAASTVTATVTVKDQTSDAAELYALINAYRESLGLTDLTPDATLSASAWQRAAETTVLPAEVRPDGSTFTQTSSGMAISDQVVIADASSAQALLDAWQGSSYADALSSTTAQSVGVGAVTDDSGAYHWVILLSDSASSGAGSSTTPNGSQTYSYTVTLPSSNVQQKSGDTTLDLTLGTGATTQLRPVAYATGALTGVDGTSYPFNGSQALGLDPSGYTWTSGNSAVVAVGSDGVATAVAAGTTTVTATTSTSTGTSTTVWDVTVAGRTESTIDLSSCTVVGITTTDGLTFDEAGNPVLPSFSVVGTDGKTPIASDEYDAAIAYDQSTGVATLTVTPKAGSTTLTGQLVKTIYPSAESTAARLATTQTTTQASEQSTGAEEASDQAQAQVAEDQVQPEAGQLADSPAQVAQTQADDGVADSGASATADQGQAASSVPDKSASADVSGTGDAAASDAGEQGQASTAVDISFATVSGIDQQSYTGSPIEPKPVVSYQGAQLVEGTDYTLSYSDNVEPGVATVTITGIGDYMGTRTATFSIKDDGKTDLASAGFSMAAIANQTFTGQAITPEVSVSNGTTTLKQGQDYVVSYADNVDAGTATVTVSAVESSSYSGSITATFTIDPLDLSYVTIVMPNQSYTGSALTPVPQSVTTSTGYALTQGIDYDVTAYVNNVDKGTGYATITGKGNFTGAQNAAFKIVDGTSSGTTTTLPKTGDTTSTVPVIAGTVAGVGLIATGIALVMRRRRHTAR